jgi:hypothetical protein
MDVLLAVLGATVAALTVGAVLGARQIRQIRRRLDAHARAVAILAAHEPDVELSPDAEPPPTLRILQGGRGAIALAPLLLLRTHRAVRAAVALAAGAGLAASLLVITAHPPGAPATVHAAGVPGAPPSRVHPHQLLPTAAVPAPRPPSTPAALTPAPPTSVPAVVPASATPTIAAPSTAPTSTAPTVPGTTPAPAVPPYPSHSARCLLDVRLGSAPLALAVTICA